jgi:hypothetical protein
MSSFNSDPGKPQLNTMNASGNMSRAFKMVTVNMCFDKEADSWLLTRTHDRVLPLRGLSAVAAECKLYANVAIDNDVLRAAWELLHSEYGRARGYTS